MSVNDTAIFQLVPYYIPKAAGGASRWIGGIGKFVIPPIMGYIAGKFGKIGYTEALKCSLFLC